MAGFNYTFPVEQFFWSYLIQSGFSECPLDMIILFLLNTHGEKIKNNKPHTQLFVPDTAYCLSHTISNNKVVFNTFKNLCLEEEAWIRTTQSKQWAHNKGGWAIRSWDSASHSDPLLLNGIFKQHWVKAKHGYRQSAHWQGSRGGGQRAEEFWHLYVR